MAMPTIVGVGAGTSNVGAMTIPYPVGYTAVLNDIALSFIETESAGVVTPPTNWAVLTSSTVASGTTTKLWVLWRRLTASEATPSIADAGDHMGGRMIVLNGVETVGNPWDVFSSTTELVADATVSIPSVTTTVADCLILDAFGTGQDVASTAGATGWTNINLGSVTERMDNWVTTGLGGGFAMATGTKATAGSTGITTATLSLTVNFKTLIKIAIKGATAAPSASDFPAWKRRQSGLLFR